MFLNIEALTIPDIECSLRNENFEDMFIYKVVVKNKYII